MRSAPVRNVLRLLRALPSMPGLVCALALVASAASVDAQVGAQVEYRLGRSMPVTIHETPASARYGGFGWIWVSIENTDTDRHVVELSVSDPYAGQSLFLTVCELAIEPGATGTAFLPLPGVGRGGRLLGIADGYVAGRFSHHMPSYATKQGVSALLVSADASTGSDWLAALQAASSEIPTGTSSRVVNGRRVKEREQVVKKVDVRAAQAMPDDWRLVSGFDLVIVDPRGDELETALQRALLQYARAGGNLMLVHADALPRESVLRTGLRRSASEATSAVPGVRGSTVTDPVVAGLVGFGQWLVADSAAASDPATLVAHPVVDRWLGNDSEGVYRAYERRRSGPMRVGFGPSASIPGVGDPPVVLFFFVLALFAFFAGPVNYFYWKRRRRLSMLLLTVPAGGGVVTLLILGFGLLSEGLGIKGVLYSMTILDQQSHTATTWAQREMFAGLTPGALRPRAETLVSARNVEASRAHYRSDPVGQALEITVGRDRNWTLSGRAVPARTISGLRSVSTGTLRERMRFRLRGDGRIDVLTGPELALGSWNQGRPSILYRDLEGRYYSGDVHGVLSPVTEQDESVRHLLGWLSEHRQVANLDLFASLATELPVGSYFAVVAKNPGVDSLGLTVEWLDQRHVVHGFVGPEDVIRD